MRIYKVTSPGSNRLVRAANQASAIRHVAHDTMQCAVASQDDLVALLSRGAKVEEPGATATASADTE
jgi:hypothetical protein